MEIERIFLRVHETKRGQKFILKRNLPEAERSHVKMSCTKIQQGLLELLHVITTVEINRIIIVSFE